MCEDWEWSSDPTFVAVAADWQAHGWDTSASDLTAHPNNNVYGASSMPQGAPHAGNCGFMLELPASPIDATLFPIHGIADVALGQWVHARLYVKYSPGYVFMGYQSGNEEKVAYFRSDGGSPSALIWRVELQNPAI